MTMSIIELMHHIVREPAPRLPEGRFETAAEEFVDACLEKEVETRGTPGVLLVSLLCILGLVFILVLIGVCLELQVGAGCEGVDV